MDTHPPGDRTDLFTVSGTAGERRRCPREASCRSRITTIVGKALLIAFGMSFGTAFVPGADAEELSFDRLFAPDRVIEVSIDLPANDWSELCKQTRDPGKVFSGSRENPFTWFKGDITIDGVTIRTVGIRKKGFIGSLDNQFPSLKVKFDEYVEQTPIRGLDSLTLNNNKQDSSLASQFLAYELFNAAGVQAPRCRFVRVTVNGEYLGIYSHIESIGKPFLERRFGNNSGNLYEGTLADFYPKAIDRLDVKTNKKNHDRSKVARLSALLADDTPALDEVEQLVNIDNFLRFWATESLIGFWDGYANNQNNFWVYENQTDGKFYFMPWGADGAFMTSGGFPGFGPRGPASVYAEGILAHRLYHNAGTLERYRETMRWLLAEVWKEDDLLATVGRIETLVTPHLHRRQANASRAMESVRQFIRTRRGKIEKELESWPARVADRPRKPIYVVEIGSVRGSLQTKWRETPPAKIVETGRTELEMVIDGKPVVLKQSGASVHRPRPSGFFGFGNRTPAEQQTTEIVISGVRDSDGKVVTFTLSVETRELSENVGKPLSVRGSFASGDDRRGGFMPFAGKIVSGSITLTSAALKTDGIVEGRFDLKISEVRGGFMDRRPGQVESGREGRPPEPPQQEAPPAASAKD